MSDATANDLVDQSDIPERVSQLRLKVIYQNRLVIVSLGILVPAPIAYLNWNAAQAAWISAWFIVIVLCATAGVGSALLFRRRAALQWKDDVWYRLFYLTNLCTGLAWGSGSWLFFNATLDGSAYFYLLILASLSVTAVPAGIFFKGFAALSFGGFVPFAARCIWLDSEQSWLILAVGAVTVIGATLVSLIIGRALSRSFYTSVYNTLLARQAVEASNQAVEAKLEAERANRAKSAFLTNMSHELRTPLNAILGFAEILSDMPDVPKDAEKLRNYAKYIQQSGDHLLRLINEILDISRAEAGKLSVAHEAVDVARLVDETYVLLHDQAAAKSIDVSLQVPDDYASLWADPVRVKQVLVNLLANAVKYCPERSHVTVSAGYTWKGEPVLQVADDGAGMTEDEVQVALSVFGRNQQADQCRSEGTGLGLPIVKAIMEAHGGRFEISSLVGQGTIARAIFPVRHAAGHSERVC